MYVNKFLSLLTAFSASLELPKHSESPLGNINAACQQELGKTSTAMSVSCPQQNLNVSGYCEPECYQVVSTALESVRPECDDAPAILGAMAALEMVSTAGCFKVDGQTCVAILSNMASGNSSDIFNLSNVDSGFCPCFQKQLDSYAKYGPYLSGIMENPNLLSDISGSEDMIKIVCPDIQIPDFNLTSNVTTSGNNDTSSGTSLVINSKESLSYLTFISTALLLSIFIQ